MKTKNYLKTYLALALTAKRQYDLAKKPLSGLIVVLVLLPLFTFAQGVAINDDDSEADPSAMLEIKSTNKGLLIPRMTQSEIEAIANPANGLIIFSTTDDKFYTFISSEATWKEIAYGTGTIAPIPQVTNPATGKTWMDRNLGASQVATSSTDATAYGDLYQWGRLMDGHEDRSSGTTPTLSSTDIPGHGDMIVLNNSPFDWRSPQNGSLWQGVGGTNNPCPAGFRIPTQVEWDEERLSWATNDAAGAFASPLKLTLGGWRHHASGALANVGSGARYWGSTINGVGSDALGFNSGDAFVSSGVHAYGFSVRCIKDEPINQPRP